QKSQARYFLPPYEWYNREIADWTAGAGLQLINYSAGTGTARDYTWPEMAGKYASSQVILDDLLKAERQHGLNGNLLLVHLGSDPRRADKFYSRLGELIDTLRKRGYEFKRLGN